MFRVTLILLVAAIAWGALSFGAVYPWGYWPLIAASTLAGAIGLLTPRLRVHGLWRVAAALGVIAVAIALQLIRLPDPWIARTSPARDEFLKRYDILYAMPGGSHAFSINPPATIVALSCFVAFALMLLGTARAISVRNAARMLAGGIAGFGLLLALFALAQNLALADQTGEGHTVFIYGFWPDPYVNKPFGPYINKNNYAGWVLMALPLSVGYCAASLTRLGRSVRPDWRSRMLALSSKDGAYALFGALAALVMGVSVIVSMSRSGMLALAATVIGFAWFAPGGDSAPCRRGARFAIAALVLLALVAWAGADTIKNRFEDRSDASMTGRFIAWQNAGRIISDFPIVGTGFNTFGTAMLFYQEGDPINFWEEAHNDYLQIVAEGGIVGAALVTLAVAVVAVEIRKRFSEESSSRSSTWIRAGAVAGLCAIALQELVEFSLQIPGNAVLFAVLVGIALHRSPRLAEMRR